MKHKFTRLTSLFLALIMSFSMLLVPANAAFVDVSGNAWYAEAVNYAEKEGWMKGVSQNSFAPNAEVTRAMFVTVLARFAKADLDGLESDFADVSEGTWYSEAVAWAAQQGITSGVSATAFAPNRAISRQDLCTMIARFIEKQGYDLKAGDAKSFNDAADIANYAKDAVALCASLGLVAGYTDGSFRPTATASRAQTAMILMRLDKAIKGENEEPVPMPAQSFNVESDGMTVKVNAPEGALPEGSEMIVERVTNEDSLAAIASRVNSKVFAAADISFFKDEIEIEPEAEVEVQIDMEGLENVENPTVIHIADDGDLNGVVSEMVSVTRGGHKVLRFRVKDFSVYAIIGDDEPTDNSRLTINFIRGEDTVATVYVKNTDVLLGDGEREQNKQYIEDIIYDPGVGGTLPAGQLFLGWSIDALDANPKPAPTEENPDPAQPPYGANYDTTTKVYTIDQVQSYVAGKVGTFKESDVLNIHAIIFKVYRVIYEDKDGVSIAADNVLMPLSATTAAYTITQNYSTLGQDENFEGWIAKTGESNISNAMYNGQAVTATEAGYKLYPQGTTMTLSGDVVFSTDISKGHWLVYDENGKNATYNAPAFIKESEKSHAPALEMQRPGYTFQGWYKIKSGVDEDTIPKDSDKNYIISDTYFESYPFNLTLNDRLVIFAKWEKVANAYYTVVIWKQNNKGDGYDFVDSIRMSASTTGTVSPVTEITNGARVNGTDYTYTGFHLGEYDSDVAINPAGGTVLNVYFDRNEYTLEFQVQQSAGYYEVAEPDWDAWENEETTYYFKRGNNYYTIDVKDDAGYYYQSYGTSAPTVTGNQDAGTYYLLVNNSIYSLRRTGTMGNRTWQAYYNGAWTNVNNISGTKYYLIGSSEANPTVYEYLQSGWHTIKTIKALYQQSIGDNFPIVGSNGTTYDNGERWDPTTNTPYKDVLVYIDIMPAANVTFHLSEEPTRPLKTIIWNIEALPGEQGTAGPSTLYMYNGTTETTVSGSGKTFVKYADEDIKARYNAVTFEEDFIQLIGFTRLGCDRQGQLITWQDGTTNWGYSRNSNNETTNFYYTRNKYKIHYFDGVYYDGRGNKLEEDNRGLLNESGEIFYDADITAYRYGMDNDPQVQGSSAYVPTYNGFVFVGWYLDKDCTVWWDGKTMPEGGVNVYAKWISIEYRVFLHPNAAPDGVRDTTLDWGDEDQQMNFRIAYNGKVSIPTGLRTGYEFGGWYTDAEFNNPYDAGTKLTNTTVPETPVYNKAVDMTDNAAKYINDEGKEDNVPMDKWGLLTDAGINKDVNRYWITRKLDLYCRWSEIIVGATGIGVYYDATNDGTNAPTDTLTYKDNVKAVAQAASKPKDTSKQFMYWVVQKWNESDNRFDDTDIHVYPGERFVVLLANAHKVAAEGNTAENPKYTYTVQLRAEYGDKDAPAPTHIYWYANNETNNVQRDENVAINAPVVIPTTTTFHNGTREGSVVTLSYENREFLGWARYEVDENGNILDGQTDPALLTKNSAEFFLEWVPNEETDDPTDGHYNAKDESGNWVEVTEVACDEKHPYNDLYAVWGFRPFFVFHSSTGVMEAITLEIETVETDGVQKLQGKKYKLTDLVADGHLYGGYYNEFGGVNGEAVNEFAKAFTSVKGDWTAATTHNNQIGQITADKIVATVDGATIQANFDPYTGDATKSTKNSKKFWIRANAAGGVDEADPGDALIPEAGKVYYLKEVPWSYLTTKYLYTYETMPGENEGVIQNFYMLTILDDAFYKDIGFRVKDGAENEAAAADADITSRTAIASSFNVVQRGNGIEGHPRKDDQTVTVNAASFGKTRGFIAVKQADDYVVADKSFTVMPAWKTLDEVEVNSLGTLKLTVASDEKSISYEAIGTIPTPLSKPYKTLYVDVSKIESAWNDQNAATWIYYFFEAEGQETVEKWVKTSLVSGKTNLYQCDIPEGNWTAFIVVRTSGNSGWDAKWNQTGNIAFSTDYNKVVLNSIGGNGADASYDFVVQQYEP